MGQGMIVKVACVSALIGISVTFGCAPDPLFMDCPLSNSINASCEAEADGIVYTCVVAEHPTCLESICASWQGGPAECTQACGSDADCPSEASCQSHLGLSFCVRNVYVTDLVVDLPDIVAAD